MYSLTRLDLEQLTLNTPTGLRAARKTKIAGGRGTGRTGRHVYAAADTRTALADYLEHERPTDAGTDSTALFLPRTTSTDRDVRTTSRRIRGQPRDELPDNEMTKDSTRTRATRPCGQP